MKLNIQYLAQQNLLFSLELSILKIGEEPANLEKNPFGIRMHGGGRS